MARKPPSPSDKTDETAVPAIVEAELTTLPDTAVQPEQLEETAVIPPPKPAPQAKAPRPVPPAPPVIPHDAQVRVRIEIESLVVNHQRRLRGETFATTYGEYLKLAKTSRDAVAVRLPGAEIYTK